MVGGVVAEAESRSQGISIAVPPMKNLSAHVKERILPAVSLHLVHMLCPRLPKIRARIIVGAKKVSTKAKDE
jgi:hypothetical protein